MDIGFNQPVTTTESYIDGFKNRIQVWQEVLRNFNFVTQYLENGKMIEYCRICQICQKRNGSTEIIYGKYRFPFGYFHTILDHYIEVPIEFQQWVMNTPIPKIITKTKARIAEERWLRIQKGFGGFAISS